MASWVTHLMIADGVLAQLSGLDRRGFCVGNIAPDCNVENADWTAFTPSRAVTHWMQGERKKASDCEAFCTEYIADRKKEIQTAEEWAFLLGYYAHLLTDVEFQAFLRDAERVKAAWRRIKKDAMLCAAGAGMEETWDCVKQLIPRRAWMRQIHVIEGEYLRDHPESGYLTEILPLTDFPDYIDYLPTGAVVRKIGVMAYLPKPERSAEEFIAISREEYSTFVEETIGVVVEKIKEFGGIIDRPYKVKP